MKRIMKSNVPKYNDEIYQKGDKIWFQDKNNKWQGPATVTEHEGRNVSFRYLGKNEETTSATHTCRIQRYYEEDKQDIDKQKIKEKQDKEDNIGEKENEEDMHETDEVSSFFP